MNNKSDSDSVKIVKLIIVGVCTAVGWETYGWMGAFFGIILGTMIVSSVDPDD